MCSACVFRHEENIVRVVAPGGDPTVLGPSTSLDWLRGVALDRMEVRFKSRLVPCKPGSVPALSRVVTVTENGLEYDAGQRRAEILTREVCVDESSNGGGDARSEQYRRAAFAGKPSERIELVFQGGGGDRQLPGPGQKTAKEISRVTSKPVDQV